MAQEQQQTFPAQHQDRQPELCSEMNPKPETGAPFYRESGS
jgi:hypothetical protein